MKLSASGAGAENLCCSEDAMAEDRDSGRLLARVDGVAERSFSVGVCLVLLSMLNETQNRAGE